MAKHKILELKYGVRLQARPDLVEQPSEYLDHAGQINGSSPRRQQICGNQGFRESQVDIQLIPERLPKVLEGDINDLRPASERVADVSHLTLSIEARVKRTGLETRMVIQGVPDSRGPDPGLLKLLAQAHVLKEELMKARGASVREIARREGLGGSHFIRLVRLAFLAPDITTAILESRHPPKLNARRLIRTAHLLPFDWAGQRASLGFI